MSAKASEAFRPGLEGIKLKSLNYRQPDPTFALGRLVLSRSKNIGFSVIPKNASSSILASLALTEGLTSIDQFESEEDFLLTAHSFTGKLLYKTESELFRLREINIVLRCPFERAISMFLNKFLFDVEEVIIGSACQAMNKERLDITFHDFVTYLEVAPDLWLDPHFRQQSRFLAFPRYTNVFMLGDAELDSYWQRTFGVSLPKANQRRVPRKELEGAQFLTLNELEAMYALGHLPSYKSFFSKRCIETIKLRFEDDFDIVASHSRQDSLLFPVSPARKRRWF